MTPDEIIEQFPHLTLSQIHSALSYYYEHKEEIEKEYKENKRFLEELKRCYPSKLKKKKSLDMKIYCDENIEETIIEGPRRKIEVVSAREMGNLGRADEYHLNYAHKIGAIIFTHDIDFLRLAQK